MGLDFGQRMNACDGDLRCDVRLGGRGVGCGGGDSLTRCVVEGASECGLGGVCWAGADALKYHVRMMAWSLWYFKAIWFLVASLTFYAKSPEI